MGWDKGCASICGHTSSCGIFVLPVGLVVDFVVFVGEIAILGLFLLVGL
jgi:hypothetical protein